MSVQVQYTRKDGSTGSYIKDYCITDELLERNQDTTPDFLDLKMQDYHAVFVYGSLQKGGPMHEKLSSCPCLGDAYTATQTFEMFNVVSEGMEFPVSFSRKQVTKKTGAICGEVYVVPPLLFLDLDYIEGNTKMYRREKKFVFLPDQMFKTKDGAWSYPAVKAWVYLGITDYWERYDDYLNLMPLKSTVNKRGKTTNYFEWETRQY